MSDTPRTDAQCTNYFGEWVVAEFARELERKNGSLERENAALRADKDRLDWLGKTKCAYFHEGPCVWRINEDETTDGDTIRAAIDAARKEKP